MTENVPEKYLLCVEDHPDLCELIATILTGFHSVSASSEPDAWEQFVSREFSFVVTDHFLEDGDGMSLVRRIRVRDPDIPIVMITGSDDISEREVLTAGANRLIRKSKYDFVDHLSFAVAELSGSLSV